MPNSLLKTAGDLIAIVCVLQNCYGTPFVQSVSNDKEVAKKMLSLCDETNELGNYVSKLKNKSEKLVQWKEISATDTAQEFPRLTFDELKEITLGELVYHL